MNEPGLRDSLLAIFRDVLANPTLEIAPDDPESAIPGFDSGRKVFVVLEVEERFGLHLRSREIDALRRFGDWIATVERHLAARR
ncbi:MAG: acyl carrier protein [Reyranellaceae bacterium]